MISFGAWGIQDWLNPAISGNAVATVGSEEIAAFDVRRRVNQEMNRMRRLFGDQFTIEQAVSFGIVDGIVNEQVNQTLINQGASKLGVTISDGLISSDIRSQDGFKGLAGNFDRIRFNQVLASNGLTEGDYINTIRRSLTGLQYTDSFRSGTRAPKVLVDTIFKYRNEKRIVNVATILATTFTDIPEPDASQIEAFHKKNAKDFTAPEYRKITFLRLDAADLASEIVVTDEDLVKAFDARAEEFVTIESRNLLQMVLPDEATAKTAHKLLLEGRDFATVAKEVAGLEESALDLGKITKSDLLPELADPAFALMQGTVSVPVKSALGWHLLKVTEIQPGGAKTLDQVRDQLQASVAKEKAVDSLYELSNALEDQLGGGATIEEAANAMNLKAIRVPAINSAGKDLAGNSIADVPAGPAFIQTTFSTDEGQDSALTESGPEGFFVVRVDGITAPALRPLDTVRDAVLEAWKTDQRNDRSKKMAEKITAEINAGGVVSAIANANGLTFTENKPFTREDTGANSGLSADLVKKVFDLDINRAAAGPSSAGYQIALLMRVTPADSVADKSAMDGLRASLTGALQTDVTQQLVTALRDDIGVDVNRGLLNQLFADQNPVQY